MGETTLISWTDSSFNPWIGCSRVSEGCRFCYAEDLMDRRYGKVKWGSGQPRQRTSVSYWKQPLRWNKEAEISLKRRRVFCASLADWLDDEVDANWLSDLLVLIYQTPLLSWQLLTKRPENWRSRLAIVQGISHDPHHMGAKIAKYWLEGIPLPNVWVGVSAEDQKNFDLRVPLLFEIPAVIRFVSAEPLLGPIRLGKGRSMVHWLIAGGESGAHARRCDIVWIADLIAQCRDLGIAPFVKQLGSYPVEHCASEDQKQLYLKHKKGEDPAEWPAVLRVREFPGAK